MVPLLPFLLALTFKYQPAMYTNNYMNKYVTQYIIYINDIN